MMYVPVETVLTITAVASSPSRSYRNRAGCPAVPSPGAGAPAGVTASGQAAARRVLSPVPPPPPQFEVCTSRVRPARPAPGPRPGLAEVGLGSGGSPIVGV
jgi:hypothetical protein